MDEVGGGEGRRAPAREKNVVEGPGRSGEIRKEMDRREQREGF